MTAKVLLLSVVIAMIAFPLVMAREPNAGRAVKRLLLFITAFNLFYLFALRYIYPRLV